MWPTFDNVISNFQQITLLAKTADFVYVHFSGHGTTCEPFQDASDLSVEGAAPVPGKFSNPSTGDTALVVLEATTKAGIRYLRGEELANLIKIMVDKGLIVTLVLDYYFSGSVMRNDSSTRYLKYNSEVDAAHPPESWLNTEGESSRTIYRNASMRLNWLIDPDGYSILTACGPTEETKDLFDDKGHRHGALSYLLLRVFAKLGHFRGQQRNIYSHLCARFRETRNQHKNEQNPILYGNKNLSFFGPVGPENNFMPVPIIKRQNHGLQLEAGIAHGVYDDDKFSVCSLHSVDNEFESRDLAIARVSHVRALTSDLEVLNGTPIPSDSGLIGIALTHLFLRRFPVRLELGLPYPEQWTRAIQDRKSLDIYNNDHTKVEPSFSFYVAVTGDKSYEVRNESSHSIQNLPTPAHDLGENAGSHILDMVEHLAIFKMVRQLANNPLENKAHPFTESFDVKLINAAGKEFNPGCFEQCSHRECLIKAESSEKLELFVRNQGNIRGGSLYLYIFNMGPNWKIENILHGNYNVLPPRCSNQHMDFN